MRTCCCKLLRRRKTIVVVHKRNCRVITFHHKKHLIFDLPKIWKLITNDISWQSIPSDDIRWRSMTILKIAMDINMNMISYIHTHQSITCNCYRFHRLNSRQVFGTVLVMKVTHVAVGKSFHCACIPPFSSL